jgi:hypothetical protein
MIKVVIGTTTERKEVIVEETSTPKEILEDAEIVYEVAQIFLDGGMLTPELMNKSLEDQGVEDTCRLIAVIKTNNSH